MTQEISLLITAEYIKIKGKGLTRENTRSYGRGTISNLTEGDMDYGIQSHKQQRC